MTLFLFAFLLAQVSPTPVPTPTINPKFCVADADVDKHIDSRLPDWDKVEIRTLMLSVPPCSRMRIGSIDKQGHLITNNYDDYVGWHKEFDGHWTRINALTVRDTAGRSVSLPLETTPPWLLGTLTCAPASANSGSQMVLKLLPNHTGIERDAGAHSPSSIELFAYGSAESPTQRWHTLSLAYAHGYLMQYAVERTRGKVHIFGNYYYHSGEWSAFPDGLDWWCTRTASSSN